jgi:hypothetical protein
LQRFVEREGHARVPQKHEEARLRLGVWVNGLRQRHRRGSLDEQQAIRLEALPGWTWDPHGAAWEDGFAHLQRFAEREGHARVPHATSEDGYRLGSWVSNQRVLRLRGQLPHERIRRLEALPGWVWAVRER